MLLQIIPVFNKFLISCFSKSCEGWLLGGNVLFHNWSSHQYTTSKLRFTSIGLKASNHHQSIRDWDKNSLGCRQAIPACNHPNHRLGKLDMLSQHAKCKQAIPACIKPIKSQESQTCYPSMQSANQNPGKLDILCQHTQHKHTIPAYFWQINLYKRGCKSPEQWTCWHSNGLYN